jgi:hypothetical protein
MESHAAFNFHAVVSGRTEINCDRFHNGTRRGGRPRPPGRAKPGSERRSPLMARRLASCDVLQWNHALPLRIVLACPDEGVRAYVFGCSADELL